MLRTAKSYSSWINCTDPMACTSDPFSCSNINLTKDSPVFVDPREGLVYQVETLLTQIGGRPCWKLHECVRPLLTTLLLGRRACT